MTADAISPTQRLIITSAVMMASTMVAVDMTIANVALPHMQSAVSASQEQIFWTLTSYMVATAIATPAVGWLSHRFGRRHLLVASLVLFTLSSMVCALAANLETLVLARTVQGLSGAALPPIAQAAMFDFYPPEKHAKMMAVLGMGNMAGPILGPTLGGWLTDAFSWRWVFFINLPFGVLALAGIIAAFPRETKNPKARFDFFGFATLSIALGAMQLFIDRGEHLDWLESTEVQMWLIIMILAIFLTVVHFVTGRDTFLRRELILNRNFMAGCLLGIMLGVIMFGPFPLVTVFMQKLLGFSAFHAGLVTAPRGVASVIGLMLVTRLVTRIDNRHLIVIGLLLIGLGQLMHARMSLEVDETLLILAGFVGGLGGGLIFAPLSVVVMSNVPAHLRTDAASMYALTRSIGSSVGISFVQVRLNRAEAAQEARLAEGLRPDSPIMQFAMPDMDFGAVQAVMQLHRTFIRQATMAAYVDIFWMVCFIAIATAPLAYLLRSPSRRPTEAPPIMVE